jgi:hypothetical protein
MREQGLLPHPCPAGPELYQASHFVGRPRLPVFTRRFIEYRRLRAVAEYRSSPSCSGRPLAVQMIGTSKVRVHHRAACIDWNRRQSTGRSRVVTSRIH